MSVKGKRFFETRPLNPLQNPSDARTALVSMEVLVVDEARGQGCHLCPSSIRPLYGLTGVMRLLKKRAERWFCSDNWRKRIVIMNDAATFTIPETVDGHQSNNQNIRQNRRTSNLRALAAGILGLSAVFTVQSANADFGAAEVGGKNNEARTFEAWCARKENNCKVSFGSTGITIDEKDSVPYNRIKNFHYGANKGVCNAYGFWCIGRAYTFDIIYAKEDGTEGVGKIIFAKEDVALSFMFNLKNATGNKPWGGDPRCERGEVFQEGICLSPTTAAEVRTRANESVNASNAVIEHGRAIGTGLAVQGELQREGLESSGNSIQQGLGNVKLQQNTGVIIVPR